MGGQPKVMFINELPDEILLYVISFLSTEDAAKARSLSRRWRHLFASPVNLHLSPSTVIGIKARSEDVPPCKYRQVLLDYKLKFMDGIDQILEQCIISSIGLQTVGTIRFSFQLSSESASRIDHWMILALQMKPRKLHLDFSFGDADMELYHVEPYRLPLRFLREAYGRSNTFPPLPYPKNTFPQLDHLILKSCFLGLDSKDRLPFLKKLDLHAIALSQHDLDNVFSCCSGLLWLNIGNCRLPETLHIGGEGLLPHLETLVVENCDEYNTIELDSLTKLRTFEFMNLVRGVNFINVPLLEKVHWRVKYGNRCFRNQIIYKLADDLSQLQFLSLSGMFFKEPPMIKFKHLKELEIFFPDSCSRTWITQLVDASPILQKLHVTILANKGYKNWEPHQTQCHHNLKEVRISGFRGAPKDMQLAISLLKNAVMLDWMYIDPSTRTYQGANEWSLQVVRWRFDKRHVRELLLREAPPNSRIEITVL